MTEFPSQIRTLPHNDERIFSMLSDLSNLERVKARIPEDKIKRFSFSNDRCCIEIDPVGKVEFQIVDREPNKTIKFDGDSTQAGGGKRHEDEDDRTRRVEPFYQSHGIKGNAGGCR